MSIFPLVSDIIFASDYIQTMDNGCTTGQLRIYSVVCTVHVCIVHVCTVHVCIVHVCTVHVCHCIDSYTITNCFVSVLSLGIVIVNFIFTFL